MATDGNCDETVLTWTDASLNESGFKIFRGVGSPTDEIGMAAPDDTTYTDVFGDVNVVYTYGIVAYNEHGNAAACEDTGWMTDTVPAAATTCLASQGQCTGVLLTWTDNSDNESGFRILRDDEVIARANELGLAMVMTGERQFRH